MQEMGAKEKARPGQLSTPGIGMERPCSEPDLLKITPYYQNTKWGLKTGQNSLRV
jgi:hypothetical protein